MEEISLRFRKDALISSLLHDRDPVIRERAALALARESVRMDADVIFALAQALRTDESERVRIAAIFALDGATLTYTPTQTPAQTLVAPKQREPSAWQRRIAALNTMSVSDLMTHVGQMTVGEALVRFVASLMALMLAGAGVISAIQNWAAAIGWLLSLFPHHH